MYVCMYVYVQEELVLIEGLCWDFSDLKCLNFWHILYIAYSFRGPLAQNQ